MGTTLVAALTLGDEAGDDIAIASVGDSRAYLFDDSGLKAVTEKIRPGCAKWASCSALTRRA